MFFCFVAQRKLFFATLFFFLQKRYFLSSQNILLCPRQRQNFSSIKFADRKNIPKKHSPPPAPPRPAPPRRLRSCISTNKLVSKLTIYLNCFRRPNSRKNCNVHHCLFLLSPHQSIYLKY